MGSLDDCRDPKRKRPRHTDRSSQRRGGANLPSLGLLDRETNDHTESVFAISQLVQNRTQTREGPTCTTPYYAVAVPSKVNDDAGGIARRDSRTQRGAKCPEPPGQSAW